MVPYTAFCISMCIERHVNCCICLFNQGFFSKSLKNISEFVPWDLSGGWTLPVICKHSSTNEEILRKCSHDVMCLCTESVWFYIAFVVMILLLIFSIKIYWGSCKFLYFHPQIIWLEGVAISYSQLCSLPWPSPTSHRAQCKN